MLKKRWKKFRCKLKFKKYVKIVSKNAKISKEDAKKRLKHAKELGIPYYRYVNNNCWTKTSDDDLIKLNEEIKKKIRERNRAVTKLSEITSFDKKRCESEIKRAKTLDIKYNTFIYYHMFDLSDKELKEFKNVLALKKVKDKLDKEFYVKQMVKKSGKSNDEIINDMEDMKKLGISYKRYALKEVYDYSLKERDDLVNFYKEDGKRISNGREKLLDEICKQTKWSRGRVELEVMKAKINCDCSYDDYLSYKLYELTPEEQKEYVTLGTYDKLRIQYNSFRATRNNFDDKANFNVVFKDYIKRVWFTNEKLTFNDFKKKINGLDKIIIKPLSSTCGIGVEAFECNRSEKQNRKIYDKIVGLDKTIIEEYINQDELMKEFCPTSVNTIRVTTILYKGKCIPIHAFVRFGNGGVVDNFHADGLAAGLDIKTGIINTPAVDGERRVYYKSPSTDKELIGTQIPRWDEVLKLCDKLGKVVKDSKLIGWDFAITDKGIDLIEGNTGAYYVSQLIHVYDKKGLMDEMVRPFLNK